MKSTRAIAGAMFAALATMLAALPAGAQSTPLQAELGVGHESLSRGLGNWQQTDFALRRRWAAQSQLEFNARRTERFGLVDSEWGLALALPVAPAWDATLAASVSPTHRVLARSSLGAGLQRAVGDGWVLGGTLRTTDYDRDRANALALSADRYFGTAAIGEWRAAATVTATRLAGLGSSGAARVQIDRFFDTHNRIGLLLSAGREIDRVGQGKVLLSDVQSAVVLGRWALGPAWALTGEVGQTRVGTQYRRSGGRLGVQLDY